MYSKNVREVLYLNIQAEDSSKSEKLNLLLKLTRKFLHRSDWLLDNGNGRQSTFYLCGPRTKDSPNSPPFGFLPPTLPQSTLFLELLKRNYPVITDFLFQSYNILLGDVHNGIHHKQRCSQRITHVVDPAYLITKSPFCFHFDGALKSRIHTLNMVFAKS